MKDPWVTCLADNLSDAMVVAATASGELRHGSVSGTLGFVDLARAAGQGDFIFDYRSVAVANMDHANVCGRSTARFSGGWRRVWQRVPRFHCVLRPATQQSPPPSAPQTPPDNAVRNGPPQPLKGPVRLAGPFEFREDQSRLAGDTNGRWPTGRETETRLSVKRLNLRTGQPLRSHSPSAGPFVEPA